MFEHIGEEPDEIGEESRAYLTEHIVKQITQAIQQHKAHLETKNAGKRNRKVSNKEGEGKEGSVLQVDINSDGSARQDNLSELVNLLSGIKDGNGKTVGKTKDSV